MATVTTLTTSIQDIVRDDSFTDAKVLTKINNAVSAISGGILLPDRRFSPPLPGLHATDTVATSTSLAYVSLPSDYQRNVFYVSDEDGDRIFPVRGGSYYTYGLFMNSLREKDLSETGEIYRVCVKGSNIYYQGIPSATEDLTIQYYRTPTDVSGPSEEPEGIPSHLQERLIKHYVCRDIFGDILGAPKKSDYHAARFFEAMAELLDFVGEDDYEPVFYKGTNENYTNGAICD